MRFMFAAASGTEATFRDANAAVTEAVGAIRAIHVRRRGGGLLGVGFVFEEVGALFREGFDGSRGRMVGEKGG